MYWDYLIVTINGANHVAIDNEGDPTETLCRGYKLTDVVGPVINLCAEDPVADVPCENCRIGFEHAMICDGIDATEQYLSETTAQHRSETALYGDSWPGAQIQIRDADEGVTDLRNKLAAFVAEHPWLDRNNDPKVPVVHGPDVF